MCKYILSLLCVASVGTIPSFAVAQNLNGGYSDCACVTPSLTTVTNEAPTSSAAGSVTFTNGDVLVDGVSADTNKRINANSQILVGEGGASLSIGQGCQLTIPGNSEVTISQPGGAGSNLCVRSVDRGVAFAPAIGALFGVGVVGGGVAAVAASTGNDDPRPAASN